jgi:hypothetical protein
LTAVHEGAEELEHAVRKIEAVVFPKGARRPTGRRREDPAEGGECGPNPAA